MAGEKSTGKEPSLAQQGILANMFIFLIADRFLAFVSLSTNLWYCYIPLHPTAGPDQLIPPRSIPPVCR